MIPEEATIVKDMSIPEAIIILKSDGIVYCDYKEGVELDVPLQMLMLDVFNELTEGKKVPFLIEGGLGVTITKEARDNAIKIEDISPFKATAVVVRNIAQALIANFFIKFNKPKSPYKVFNNKEEAIEWLKEYR